jgi:hypothetical protein
MGGVSFEPAPGGHAAHLGPPLEVVGQPSGVADDVVGVWRDVGDDLGDDRLEGGVEQLVFAAEPANSRSLIVSLDPLCPF